MFNRIGNCTNQAEIRPISMHEDRYARNELEDMKKGLEYLYEFKEKISKLHPVVLDAIENMLQFRNRF